MEASVARYRVGKGGGCACARTAADRHEAASRHHGRGLDHLDHHGRFELEAARSVAEVLSPDKVFIDINSVSPGRKREAAGLLAGRGTADLDMALMTPPVHPTRHRTPVLLAGDVPTCVLRTPERLGFRFEIVGDGIGEAAAVKMVRNVFVKGLEAITVEALRAAEAAGGKAMRHIQVNGGGINVAEQGPADGPTIVFSNSLGTDMRVWDDVVARLPPGLRLIRSDKRGHGLSSEAPASRTIEAHAADLAAVLDALGGRPALVVGLSIGGLIGQTLAVMRPDLVAGLVLLDTAHRIGTQETWDSRIAAVREGGMEAIAVAVMQRWFSEAFRRESPDVVAAWRMLVARSPAGGYIAACEAIRDADLIALSPRVAVPTRFAVGTEDRATPPDLVRSAAALVPGALFDLIDGVGHLPPVERPDVVARHVLAQLGNLDLA